MVQYRDVSFELSRQLTCRFSTSFSWGIKVFSREAQNAIYSIYGMVRVADEIVDTFHDQDQAALLHRFREETREAMDRGMSPNPILEAFQATARRYQIPWEYVEAFLASMEMDLTKKSFSRAEFDQYVYGSAEVVGLMCQKVFCHGQPGLFEALLLPARRFGAALQKVNFLRDIKADMEERGRIYLPGVDSRAGLNDQVKRQMETEIAQDFETALEGIRSLPLSARLGVYSVYLYYFKLFEQLKAADTNHILKQRVSVSDGTKLFLLVQAFLTYRTL